jgi:hypothetical protein
LKIWPDFGKLLLKILQMFIILEKKLITPLLEVNQFWWSIEASYGLLLLREFRFPSAWFRTFPTPLCRALVAVMVRSSPKRPKVRKLQEYAKQRMQQWGYEHRWSSILTATFITKFEETNVDGCIIQLSRKFFVTGWTFPMPFCINIFFQNENKVFCHVGNNVLHTASTDVSHVVFIYVLLLD